MADAKTINGYNLKDAAAREAIANLDTVKLASEGGASGSIRFGIDSNGNYGYYQAGADTVTPFSSGGDFEETVLWTNSSPTTSFGAQTITGLNNLSQYDYIGVYCRQSTSVDTETFELMPYDDFKNTQWVNTKMVLGVSHRGTNTIHTRAFTYVSDTSIYVASNWYISFDTSVGTTSNGILIPVRIVGVKKGRAVYPKPISVETAKDAGGYSYGTMHFDVTDYTSVTFTVHVSGNTKFVSSGGTRVQGTYTDDITNITDFYIGAYSLSTSTVYIDSIEFS